MAQGLITTLALFKQLLTATSLTTLIPKNAI